MDEVYIFKKITRKKFPKSWIHRILQREGTSLQNSIDEMVRLQVS